MGLQVTKSTTMGPTNKEDNIRKMSPNGCFSVKSEPRRPTKSWRGSPVKSCSKVKGPVVARSKILNMDLTGWDEASHLNTDKRVKNYQFMLKNEIHIKKRSHYLKKKL